MQEYRLTFVLAALLMIALTAEARYAAKDCSDGRTGALVSLDATVAPTAQPAEPQPATLHGSLEPERSDHAPRLPDSIAVRLWRVGSEEEGPVAITCAVAEGAWSCPTPAGVFDAEVRAKGFAPHYLWGVTLEAGKTFNAGMLALAVGATVSGTATNEGSPLDGVTAELTPEAGAVGNDARRTSLRTQSVKTDEYGRFAFPDVARGSFLLVLRKSGYSTVSRPGVRVEPPVALQVPALEVKQLASLRLYVTPPVDFSGKPWTVHVRQPIPASAYYQVVRRGPASEIGEWVAEELDSGAYTIEVRDSRGNRIEQRDVELLQDDILTLVIERFAVEGTISVGGEPVKASITLKAEDGSSLDFASDAEGRFTGSLTREGRWRASIRFDQRGVLHLAPMEVRRGADGVGRVTLELPGGKLAGRVVDETGKPAAATILLFRGEELELSAQAAEDGTFRFIGLEEGPRRVQAMSAVGETGRSPVDITEKNASETTLTVRTSRRIRGRLVDASGQPVPGAKILSRSSHSEQRGVESGLQGDFAIAVPPEATIASLAIVTPGFPIRMMTLRPPFGSDQPMTIVLGSPAARLHIDCRGTTPPWPEVSLVDGLPFALFHLFLPRAGGPPREYTPPSGFTLEVEPGQYQVCWTPAGTCAPAAVAPGTRKSIQLVAKSNNQETP